MTTAIAGKLYSLAAIKAALVAYRQGCVERRLSNGMIP
jgi:hypothetical protein